MNSMGFGEKEKRFADIFLKRVGETRLLFPVRQNKEHGQKEDESAQDHAEPKGEGTPIEFA